MYTSGALILTLTLLVLSFPEAEPVNHWSLQDGRITHKIDSPFYMREPDNLPAFLQQIQTAEFVETTYLQLLRQREQIVDYLRFSVKFGEELVEQAKCAMEYYLLEKRTSYLKVSADYLRRLQLPNAISLAKSAKEPDCSAHGAPLPSPAHSYDHLESLRPGAEIPIRVEKEIEMDIVGVAPSERLGYLRRLAAQELQERPQSWRSHTLGSYYWRMRGYSREALACAYRGVLLAPNSHRHIALLSLGVVLTRIGALPDATVILSAAVEQASDVPENHMALGTALARKHDFKQAIHHFDEADRLDRSLLPRTQAVRNFITCMDNLTKRTSKMYSYVEYMLEEVENFKKLKQTISQRHERLVQQQVPLNSRDLGPLVSREELLQRGQYCSTRTLATRQEPVLYCDFYSDLQKRLESKDVDIESLERDLKVTADAVMQQFSLNVRSQLNFKAEVVPTSSTVSAGTGKVPSSKDK